MKLYSAFVKKNNDQKISDVVLLKEGFSFWAFLFGPIWFVRHKMWIEFAVLLLATIALSGFSHSLWLNLALDLLVAVNANYWLAEHLVKSRQYKFVGSVFGSNSASAGLRFMQDLKIDFDHLDETFPKTKSLRAFSLKAIKKRLSI